MFIHHLWFEQNVRHALDLSILFLRKMLLDENFVLFRVFDTCYKTLFDKNIPRLSKLKGFVYGMYSKRLLSLEIITKQLVSSIIPFTQIRRRHFVHGSSIINVIHDLPWQLDDDFTNNVHIKSYYRSTCSVT